jgi:hypothetical protein
VSKRTRLKKHLQVPLIEFGGQVWGDLTVFGRKHELIATTVKPGGRVSFLNQHGVGTVSLEKMVHWKIPSGVDLDISDVGTPRRRVVGR